MSGQIQPTASSKGKLLVVDDEQLVLTTTATMLRRLGYDVYTASSGEEAVIAFSEADPPFDLAILDMTMPGLGGAGTFNRIREISPTFPFLIYSGFYEEDAMETIRGRDPVAFLQKPFTLKEISGRVSALLGAG